LEELKRGAGQKEQEETEEECVVMAGVRGAEQFGAWKALLLELDSELTWGAHDSSWRTYRPRWLSAVQSLSPRSVCASASLLMLDFEASLCASSQSTWWCASHQHRCSSLC